MVARLKTAKSYLAGWVKILGSLVHFAHLVDGQSFEQNKQDGGQINSASLKGVPSNCDLLSSESFYLADVITGKW